MDFPTMKGGTVRDILNGLIDDGILVDWEAMGQHWVRLVFRDGEWVNVPVHQVPTFVHGVEIGKTLTLEALGRVSDVP